MNRKINWGILSTGHIAELFAKAVLESKTGILGAVASRQPAQAERFARKHKIPMAYGSYRELLRDPFVDVVYIATPHSFHAEWAQAAARAGKHILCEKPLTLHYPAARRVIQAAKHHKVFFMEAFMYRCHPQTAKLVELVKKKAVGELKLIQASFCFERPLDLKGRLFNRALGGGAIWDVGCYPVSMARLLAGAAKGLPFVEPLEVKGVGLVGAQSRVDEFALGSLKFPGGILAELSCANRVRRPVGVTLYGTKGSIQVPSPWHADRFDPKGAKIRVLRDGRKPLEITLRSGQSLYSLEVDAVGSALRKGAMESPFMPWNDSLGNAKVLDAWMRAVGL
ncbi:MAG TPA: Gfo/Idh/MocA family oxidoreductase [bacterium]|nr:Gfo/Idh/MocA family oxidoreductase [bacterium]